MVRNFVFQWKDTYLANAHTMFWIIIFLKSRLFVLEDNIPPPSHSQRFCPFLHICAVFWIKFVTIYSGIKFAPSIAIKMSGLQSCLALLWMCRLKAFTKSHELKFSSRSRSYFQHKVVLHSERYYHLNLLLTIRFF